MKTIILLALTLACLTSCRTTQPVQTVVVPSSVTGETERVVKVNEKDAIPVRLTVYWSKGGGGSDRWTRRGQSSTGEKLSEGVSVAADPHLFPYGTCLYIDGVGVRKVVDTGSAVVDRTAAVKGAKMLLRSRQIDHSEYRELTDAPVVDLYFVHKADALEFASANPMFTDLFLIKN